MICDTCLSMTQNLESMGTELIFLKSRNKILVSVNRALSDRVKVLQAHADILMEELCKGDLGSNDEQGTVGLPEPAHIGCLG